ncbi:hypothetical protein ILUMI_24896 [Ignelater luminosus]|uniref:Peptidase S1 domain-containing protein n=1 Tax=Ignelater luminosus TaxID=2038154 RepID=A0A8K0FYB8_IGNLU|nr:hypothetical protein ILUMI_24896 [Ignelater luminosus]
MPQINSISLFVVFLLSVLFSLQSGTITSKVDTTEILEYFTKTVLQSEDNNKECLHETCKQVSLPLGERVFSLPDDGITFDKVTKSLDVNLEISGRRIIGGKPVPITDFPYIVSLQQRNTHACGGTYVKSTWILSAAHCMVLDSIDSPLKNPSEFTAIMGSAAIAGEKEGLRAMQVRRVVMMYPHEDYTRAIALNDIGLVKIEKPFEMGPGVGFVPLPNDAYDGEYRREICTVVGWGVTSSEKNNSQTSPILLSVDIPRITISQCQMKYDVDRIVSFKILCAGEDKGGKDACQGDSGGPLICRGMEIGLVSWGKECGHENQPGVYTRVDYYLDWIQRIMKRYTHVDMFIIPHMFSRSNTLLFCSIFYKIILIGILNYIQFKM